MPPSKGTASKLPRFTALLHDKKSMLIVVQDYPDPDAIAAAAALRLLVNKLASIPCSIMYGGTVGRSENLTLVKYLDLSLRKPDAVDLASYDIIAMVDTQPGTGNNPLSDSVVPDIVIDHHPIHRATRRAAFTDIRKKYGSTSTILFEYLQAAGIEPEMPLATALLYGIQSDTHEMGSETCGADMAAFLHLYPLANKRILGRIRRAPVPEQYFQMLANGLKNAMVYGNVIVTGLGPVDNPDMIAEVADMLLRDEAGEWVLCHGIYQERMLISIRTLVTEGNAGKIAHRIVRSYGTGGGHSMMAGGQIPVSGCTEKETLRIARTITRRFLRATRAPAENGRRLVKQ